MDVRRTRRTAAATGAGLLTLLASSGIASAQPSDGRTIYGVTSNGNRLVSFPANNPGAAKPVLNVNGGAIIGIPLTERVVGIDFRPVDGVLFALTTDGTGESNSQTGTGRLYTVDKTTAVATLVNTLTVQLSGAFYDIGFNPVANELRVVSSSGQNLRVGTGGTGTTTADAALAYASGDTNAGASPRVAGVDYTPASGSATTLYDVDYGVDALSVQGAVGGGTAGTAASPNSGVLTTVGATGLGVNVTNLLGVDYEVDGTGYASAQTVDPGSGGVSSGTTLFTINNATGKLTPIGAVAGDLLDSIAIDTAAGTPPAALPEFGVAALGPVAAMGAAGGVLVFRRRRTAKA
jgi:hypothetical protein